MKIIEGSITSKFGKRIHPITKQEIFHNGVDIGCPIGSEILSPVNGEVKNVYDHIAGGKTVIVGDEDKRFGFCHLSRIFFPKGTKITKGSIIALSGNTGKSTGPHCHFTIKIGGKWEGHSYIGGEFVNPENYLEV